MGRHIEEPSRLEGMDGLWLTLDKNTEFDPVIVSTWTFGSQVPLEDLRASLKETADTFTRFKCRLDKGEKSFSELPRFVKDARFDISNHVTSVELPQPAGRREFDKFCSDFISRPWDFSRSPWEAVLATNYQDEEGARSAVAMRVYHTISDGQGLVRASLWATDYRDEVEKLVLKPKASKVEKAPGSWNEKTVDWLKTTLWTIFQTATFLLFAGLSFLHFRHLTPSNLGERLDTTVPWKDKPHRNRTFNEPEGPRRRHYARSKAVKLSDIKTIQKAFTGNGQALIGKQKLTTKLAGDHVTLNDVIISILAEILHARRDALKAEQSRFGNFMDAILPDRVPFIIPVSLRAGHEPTAKNVVTVGLIFLPKSGVAADPDKRDAQHVYESIHRQKFELTAMKKSRTPTRIATRWLGVIGHIEWLWPWPFASIPGVSWFSGLLTTPVLNAIWAVPTCIATNVKANERKVKLAGKHELLSWHVAPPQGSSGTLGIGILSQAGKLTISVLADDAPGKEGLARSICDDFIKVFGIYLRLAKTVLKEE